MKNNIITILGGIALGSAITFGAITSPTVITDQQLYILTEILQDRVPQVDVAKTDIKKFNEDYIEVMKFVKDDVNKAVEVCYKNRGDDCNIFLRIKQRVNEVSAVYQ